MSQLLWLEQIEIIGFIIWYCYFTFSLRCHNRTLLDEQFQFNVVNETNKTHRFICE